MTEPTRDALHAATLAMLADERVRLASGTYTNPDALSGVAKMLAEHSEQARASKDALLAYAAACVRFVAALDAGEIAALSKRKDGRVSLYSEECLREYEDEPVVADTTLEAFVRFRAAQDHLGGGDA